MKNIDAIFALREFESRCISALLGSKADDLAQATRLWEQSNWHHIIEEMVKEYSV